MVGNVGLVEWKACGAVVGKADGFIPGKDEETEVGKAEPVGKNWETVEENGSAEVIGDEVEGWDEGT